MHVFDVGIESVLRRAERIGPDRATQLNPQQHGSYPSPVPRAGYALATLQRPATQLRSYTIIYKYKVVKHLRKR